jgi:hypothetical protein
MDNEQQGEMDWLLDGMVEYLKSPVWTTEVCDFIDLNCILFNGEI